MQVPQAGKLPSKDPRSLVLPGRRGEAAEEVNNQATQKPTADPKKLGYVTDFRGPGKKLPQFSPKLVPGLHGEKVYPRGSPPSKAVDYFIIIFTLELLQKIVNFLNQYAVNGKVKRSHMEKGNWRPITLVEFKRFLAFLLYKGIIKTLSLRDYWSKKFPFKQLIGDRFMPHKQFLAIMAALQCYDYQTTNLNDPLNKVCPIYNLFRKSLSDLYYPYQFISVDERMVKSKARFFFKQYIMNKSVKWGFKLWTLACSVTGYTIDIQLAELNDTDRNLEGDIDLQGKSVAEVLCTLTRGAEQIERQ